jgi:hypothetical protein
MRNDTYSNIGSFLRRHPGHAARDSAACGRDLYVSIGSVILDAVKVPAARRASRARRDRDDDVEGLMTLRDDMAVRDRLGASASTFGLSKHD